MPVVHANEEMAQVAPGSYEVECIETGSFYMENDMYGNPDKVRIKVRVGDDDDAPILDALCNEKLSPKSTLWRWAEAFGLSPEVGGDLDTDEMVGRKALAVIGERKTERGTWARIEDFVPLPKSRSAKAPTKPVGAAERAEPDDLSDWLRFDPKGEPVADWQAFWATATKYKIKRAAIFKELDVEPADFPGSVDLFELPAVLSKLAVPF